MLMLVGWCVDCSLVCWLVRISHWLQCQVGRSVVGRWQCQVGRSAVGRWQCQVGRSAVGRWHCDVACVWWSMWCPMSAFCSLFRFNFLMPVLLVATNSVTVGVHARLVHYQIFYITYLDIAVGTGCGCPRVSPWNFFGIGKSGNLDSGNTNGCRVGCCLLGVLLMPLPVLGM